MSIYDKSHLVSTVLQDPDGQFIGLTVAEDIAFALENDVVAQEEMASIVEMWAKRLEIAPLCLNVHKTCREDKNNGLV